MDKLKAAEVIADAATPAVETAMQIGEKIAEKLDKPVEVVFEIIEKTPMNTKKVALIAAGLITTGVLAGAGYWYWSKKKRAKAVILGEVVEDKVDEELDNLIKAEEAAAAASSKKNGK